MWIDLTGQLWGLLMWHCAFYEVSRTRFAARALTHGCECGKTRDKAAARRARPLLKAPQSDPSSVQPCCTRSGLFDTFSKPEVAPSQLSKQFPWCGLERGTRSPIKRVYILTTYAWAAFALPWYYKESFDLIR